ncbi:MAG: hypothetical protein AB8B94_08860 [Hyphomicrobiales bacterium]
MTRDTELFGTDQPPVSHRTFSIERLSFLLEDGGLRHIKLDGIEAIRGINFLVRDRDWGTLSPQIFHESINQNEDIFCLSFLARYESQGAQLDIEIIIQAGPRALSVSANGHASGAFETNRAGFTVLHPIDGVAGQPVCVAHSDTASQFSHFPMLIDPWQPFMDITGLTHHVSGNLVTCRFSGDVFEMEDQRQWGDASFKTYNRPLAKPWPYQIEDGMALVQSVEITWTEAESCAPLPTRQPSSGEVFPQMALVMTSQDAQQLANNPHDLQSVNPQRLLCHLDTTLGDTAAQFDAFSKAQQACSSTIFDLELICCCDADPEPELLALASQMKASNFAPESVLVCPSVDRQSTPPGSNWPDCPPLTLVHSSAAKAFPNIIRGGGVVSFFPEFNRKRPPVAALDFVSHGLCPIVHAADDLSVMETLETIPHITQSARAIIGDKPYRIGPATIAMRQNPYGKRTIPNHKNARICMADDDPRHRAKFGAAYAIGLATALAPAGISVWTPAALYGPRGVISDQETWPLTDALKNLASLAGHTINAAKNSSGMARLSVGSTELTANLTGQRNDSYEPYEWRARVTQS